MSERGNAPVVVLLVDDQTFVAEAVKRMLVGEPDIVLHFCADPTAAVDVAKTVKPTVILQDLVMPNMSGMRLLGTYKHDPDLAGIPVVVLSAKEEPIVKSQAFAEGASDYLVKLPDRIELVARLRLHSQARVNQLQRDDAYRALRASEQQLVGKNAELVAVNKKLEEASEALRFEAMHDALSGLFNRRALFTLFEKELARADRRATPLAVLMSDIDHFKAINDRYGHRAGDAVISEVAKRLTAVARQSDIVARYGGEEYVVVASDCSPDAAKILGERFRQSVAATAVATADLVIPVTMSIGIATTATNTGPESLLRAADEALYRAKRGGRNKVEIAALA